MNVIKEIIQRAFVSLLVFLILQSSFAQEKNHIENVKLPPGWEIRKIITVPKDKLIDFSYRLGGELISAQNYIIDVKGIMLRVNIAEAKTQEDAKKIYQSFLSFNKKKEECLLKGTKVLEFISNSTQLIEMTRKLLGGESTVCQDMMDNLDRAVWEAKILLAPIEKADYMTVNTMFNLLISYRVHPDNAETRSKILDLKKQFIFSDTIRLRHESPPWGAPEYFLENAKKTELKGDVIIYTVDNPHNHLGIPCIEIRARIPVKSFSCYLPGNSINKQHLTADTKYWPTQEKKIVILSESILRNEMTFEQKVEAIHRWILNNLKYGGEVVGSRYGVMRVLEQKYGRCWDFCDVFITLCRAANIPSRQVMGWIYGKSGHVWVEYFIPEKGWCSIDPSTPSSGVTTDYVPFFISEEGELPAIYWDEPHLQPIKANR